jgi:hypothetical protein
LNNSETFRESLDRINQGKYLVYMSITVEKLTEEVLALPSDARAMLADRLVESLDPVTDDAIRELWATEAIRRRDEVRSGAVKTIPASDVLTEAHNLIKK